MSGVIDVAAAEVKFCSEALAAWSTVLYCSTAQRVLLASEYFF